jgi:hypothetical protein
MFGKAPFRFSELSRSDRRQDVVVGRDAIPQVMRNLDPLGG